MDAIKDQLIHEIRANEDEDFLKNLLTWIQFNKDQEPVALTPEMRTRIAFGREQVKSGQTIPHRKAMELLDQWVDLK